MRLDWPACVNVRDLGGLPTADGRTAYGAIIRADDLTMLTPAGVAALRVAGVGRVLDLRRFREIERAPGPFAGEPIYCHRSMIEEVSSYVPPADTYGPMLEVNRDRIARAFRALAEAPPGAVVVHCFAGRDRTGVLVALALTVAGVEPASIVADYALTAGADPAAISNTLDYLDVCYGGVASYLDGIGISPPECASVRARLASGGRPTSPRSGRSARPAAPPAR